MEKVLDTVIIYCHPNDKGKKNRLLGVIEQEVEKQNHYWHTYNLIGDLFSPSLMSSDDEQLEVDDATQTTAQIQDEINECKYIFFVFPHYWDNIATYIRRFVDKVFFSPDKQGNTFASNKNLRNTKAVIVTSMRIPQILFSSRSAGGYSDPFTISVLKLVGIKNIKWFNIGYWSERNEKTKNRKLEKIQEYIRLL